MNVPAPAAVQILARALTEAEAQILHHELKTTPNILGYSPTELLHFSHVWVASDTETGAFAGACLCKDLFQNWTDIAVLYVLPAFRGRGISRPLWQAAFADAHETRKRHIYVLSRSPQIIHLMEEKGMTLTRSPWKAPPAVHLHTQCHMANWYRTKEAFRKMPERQKDGNSFVAGTKRAI